MSVRAALIAAAVAAILVGAWLSMGEPRLTMVNAGLSVTYPWADGLGSLLACAGFAGIVALVGKIGVRVAAALLAFLSLWVGLHLLTYRLDTTTDGIAARSHLVRREIAWRDVIDVGLDLDFIVLAARGQQKIEIDTTDFTADQRAALNRTIARRVSEQATVPAK
jgi:hypothetical protein